VPIASPVASARSGGGAERHDLCRHCGTTIDFLSSCPSCGTVAGIDPSLSDGESARLPKLTLVAPPVGAAGTPPPPAALQVQPAPPSGAPRRSVLPEELTRAWDITAGPKARPAKSQRRRQAGLTGLVLLAAAGVTAGVLAARSTIAPPGGGPGHAQRYAAPGAPFSASFPAPTMESHAHLRLAGLPYTTTAYTAFSGSQVFSATVYPFPRGKLTMTAEQFLQNFTQRFARSSHLSIPGSTPTTFGGLPALAALFKSPGGNVYIKVLEVLDGHIGYVLTVSGNSPSPPGYAAFVGSFKLGG
jgi:hypothetical protein